MTSTNSNFQNTSFIDIGSLELALSGGNFNGPLSISKTPALAFSSVRVTSTTNLQATTFTGIDDLTLTLNGGNANGTITVDHGGSARRSSIGLTQTPSSLIFQTASTFVISALSIKGSD